MKLTALVVALLSGCTFVAGRSPPPPPAPVKATLFFSADLRGSLEPCGCSQGMRGGLSRLAQVVNHARADGHLVRFFDAGNGLFPSADLPEAALGQQERKAATMAQGLTLAGLTARAPGPFDDAQGPAFRLELGLPEVAPATLRRVELNGYTVAVIHAGALTTAQALAATARREGAVFVVALVPLSLDAALPGLAEASGLDLVLAAAPRDELAAEQNRLVGQQTKLAQVQNKGRSLLRVDLVLRDAGRTDWLKSTGERDRELAALDERVELTRAQVNDPSANAELKSLREAKLTDLIARRAGLAAQPLLVPEQGNVASAVFVPVEATLPKDPRVAQLERDYHREVGELNLRYAQEHGQACPPAAPDAGFIGAALCTACHPEATAVWKQTKHPLAYESLVNAGRQYHLDCVACHVGLWQQPGGVCRVDQTSGHQGVECESCHGPGARHLASPVKGTIPRGTREVCVTCHDRENSPHFDFETYTARIRGPGHGLPKQRPAP